MSIAIDFAPGLHGHFLEYIINRYIFGIPSDSDDIFQATGAAHRINWDKTFQQHKISERGHFSAFNYSYPKTTQHIIWIKHDQILDFVLMVNVFERCSPSAVRSDDFNVEDIKKLHLGSMFDKDASLAELRNNWFNALEEFHNKKITSLKHQTNLPTFDFDFRAFFDLPNFILELEKTAEFLSMTLRFDESLVKLWDEFIKRNLGFDLYKKANYLLHKIIENSFETIDNDWRMHSYINYRLSKIFRIYDGPLFDQSQYPKDTQTVHRIMVDHVESFDSRF